ncbi:MAG: M48 family metalloprotease [Candidatus Nanoarchaeia archaeon]
MTTFYKEIASNKRKSYILISLFIVGIIFFGYLLGAFFGNIYAGVFIAFLISMIFTLIGYYSGDSLVLQISGARPATKREFPYLINTVEGLALAAGLPLPKVYVIDDPNPNAFATGRDEQHASIAATTGLLNLMNRTELEGVLAHEMSHIKNYDVRFMTFVTIFAGIVVLLSDFFVRGFFFSSGDSDNRPGAVFLVVGIILAILTPVFAQLIKLSISRKREFLADASGAQLSRHPEGLANALKKLKEYKGPGLKTANKATAHLYISNPFKNASRFFSSHPPLEERIKKLEAM